MKLVRLYSNDPTVFQAIDFNDGLSVIMAEIRQPQNRELNTHNLGKTTVGPLLDFCLLKSKDKSFFLFKHKDLFHEFVFYLEIVLEDGRYVTIRRAVNSGTRVSIILSYSEIGHAHEIPPEEWDYRDVPFDRAKSLVDGILDFSSLSPWDYRILVGYLIRDQSDYGDVFKLAKFAGKHAHWKPFVAHLLGVPADLVVDLYEKRSARDRLEAQIALYGDEWSIEDINTTDLKSQLEAKRHDVQTNLEVLDSIDFGVVDDRVSDHLVEDIDVRIQQLNERMYALKTLVMKIEKSLSEWTINFRVKDAQKLFEEAGVLLGDQVVKNYEQLIGFNRAITRERKDALNRQLKEVIDEREQISRELQMLQRHRSELYGFLQDSESVQKLKVISRETSLLQGEVVLLENRLAAIGRLNEMKEERKQIVASFNDAKEAAENGINLARRDKANRFTLVREYFSEFIHNVLGQDSEIDIQLNSEGGLEFFAQFVDDSGNATSESKGTSYKKLLCMAFDFAVLRAHLDVRFPRFVFHDGAFEQLDRRKKENLLLEIRRYAELGLQPVITTLDSDVPMQSDEKPVSSIEATDIVLTLHDDGEQGRLFRMPRW